MSNERISTGIAGLDTLLHGGFNRGRTYLFAGEAGTGKTIACLQFVAIRLKEGDKAVYVTVDERPSEILESAAALGWNLQPYIQDKQLIVLDAAPYFGARGGGEKGIDPQKIVADLGNYVRRLGATLLIIDPVTPFILPPDADQSTTGSSALADSIGANANRRHQPFHRAALPRRRAECHCRDRRTSRRRRVDL